MISIFNPYAMAAFALALIGASAAAYTKGRIDGSDVARIERLESELAISQATLKAEQSAKAEIIRQAEAQRAIGEASAAGEVALAAAVGAAQERANDYAEQLRREREARAKDSTCPPGYALSPADVQWLRSIGEGRGGAAVTGRPPDPSGGANELR